MRTSTGKQMKGLALVIVALTLTGCMSLLPCQKDDAVSVPPVSTCLSERKKLLDQDLDTFDQAPYGLRSVYTNALSCKLAAAELIEEYRLLHPEVSKEFNSYLLYWHEGQLRAETGDYESAAKLFEQARMAEDVNEEVRVTWNLYVDATKAFVQRDWESLILARRKLATVPAKYLLGSKFPPNLHVVDGLVRCFERTYADAYQMCRAPRDMK